MLVQAAVVSMKAGETKRAPSGRAGAGGGRERRWSAVIVARYALFQLPGLAVVVLLLLLMQRWMEIKTWWF